VVEELDVYGLVHAKWMYPIGRALKMLKTYVKNRAYPKASMAKGYLYDKTIGFVILYMQDFSHVRHKYGMQTKKKGYAMKRWKM